MKKVVKKLADFMISPLLQKEKDDLEREILEIKKLRAKKQLEKV